jgi:hypothetical protein
VRKAPTLADYEKYDGAHCFRLWSRLDGSWTCPACGRTKFELLRWTRRYFKLGIGKCPPYHGWMAGLHEHHDHFTTTGSTPRFAATVICDQCNSADGYAKRRLKLPPAFSFSPQEIRQFVVACPHSTHRVILAEARRIFDEVQLQKAL